MDFSNPRSFRALDKTAKWAFVAHGFLGSCYRDWPLEMLKVLSESEPMNVCCVGWSEWAKCNYVNDAVDHVYQVGDYLAETVNHLHRTLSIDLNRFILIGHSFGGIIIGIAGKHFKNPRLPLGIGDYRNVEANRNTAITIAILFTDSSRPSGYFVHSSY